MAKLSGLVVRRRISVLFLGVLGVSFLLLLRLAYIQLIQNNKFMDMALDQRLRPFPVDARRGSILDRNGNELAVSISADAVYAVPVEITEKEKVAATLSSILQMPSADVLKLITKRQASVWIRRKVDPDVARKVRELKIRGVYVVERPQRFYPNGKLAAQLLGISGVDNQGLEGLEKHYDQVLRGVPGRIEAERDAAGREIPGGFSRFVQPQDGQTLVLTVDKVIQYRVEQELATAVERTLSDYGISIVMSPKTGEILAMAVAPTYDPNEYNEYPADFRRNRAVADQYEPGSTFKVVTAASALAAGVVKPTDSFFDPGAIKIGGGTVNCWRRGGHGAQNFVEAVENSCNPVFAILGGERLGGQRFYQYIKAFGFGGKLGIDFPGEATGDVPIPGKVKHGELLQWANTGFGQGIAVTPLQMVTATATIANKGVLMRPHLVKEIRDQSGQVMEQFEPEAVRQVIPTETAKELAIILRSVVVNGSGSRAEVPGYRVAGKTGTAQVAEGGAYRDKRLASFVGFAPVDDPEIAAIVMLYNPKVQPKYGGVWAAPVFAAVSEDALTQLRVKRRDEPKEAKGEIAQGTVVRVPNVRNFLLEDATAALSQAGLMVGQIGEGSVVVDQTPKPGAEIPKGTTVMLSFYEGEEYHEDSDEVTVPNVVGRGLRDAANLLSDVGLRLRIVGSGVAVRQSPAPGQKTLIGGVVSVEFEPPPQSNSGEAGSTDQGAPPSP